MLIKIMRNVNMVLFQGRGIFHSGADVLSKSPIAPPLKHPSKLFLERERHATIIFYTLQNTIIFYLFQMQNVQSNNTPLLQRYTKASIKARSPNSLTFHSTFNKRSYSNSEVLQKKPYALSESETIKRKIIKLLQNGTSFQNHSKDCQPQYSMQSVNRQKLFRNHYQRMKRKKRENNERVNIQDRNKNWFYQSSQLERIPRKGANPYSQSKYDKKVETHKSVFQELLKHNEHKTSVKKTSFKLQPQRTMENFFKIKYEKRKNIPQEPVQQIELIEPWKQSEKIQQSASQDMF